MTPAETLVAPSASVETWPESPDRAVRLSFGGTPGSPVLFPAFCREKLMAYLTDQAKLKRSNDFTIPFNRQELADYLGVERSARSAELGKLTKLGILRTQRSHFTLLKPLD